MKLAIRTSLGVIAFVLVVVISYAAGRTPRVTGIYSDMQYIDEAGDVLGTEVFIVYSTTGYHAVIQVAEGAPSVPVVVPVRLEGSSVSFSLPASLGGGDFHGQVTDMGLTGRFASGRVPWNLKRGKSYWQ